MSLFLFLLLLNVSFTPSNIFSQRSEQKDLASVASTSPVKVSNVEVIRKPVHNLNLPLLYNFSFPLNEKTAQGIAIIGSLGAASSLAMLIKYPSVFEKLWSFLKNHWLEVTATSVGFITYYLGIQLLYENTATALYAQARSVFLKTVTDIEKDRFFYSITDQEKALTYAYSRYAVTRWPLQIFVENLNEFAQRFEIAFALTQEALKKTSDASIVEAIDELITSINDGQKLLITRINYVIKSPEFVQEQAAYKKFLIEQEKKEDEWRKRLFKAEQDKDVCLIKEEVLRNNLVQDHRVRQ